MVSKLRLSRINAYVGVLLSLTCVALFVAWQSRSPFPGLWGLFVVSLLALLLGLPHTQLRGGGGRANLTFLVHLAAVVVFGGFWAAAIAIGATLLSQLRLHQPINRVAFNAGQIGLSVLVGSAAYSLFGGTTPPALLQENLRASFDRSLTDLLAYVAAVAGYVLTNSVSVSGAVAISSGRTFKEVWRTNTLWVLGYDLAASFLALVIAWSYLLFERVGGVGRFGFLAVFVPIIVAKHIYGKLNSLQALYDELDRAHERLGQAVREQLVMMVKSIEARDPYTSGHSRRVAAISRAIAEDHGLSEDLVEEIENAALLHDVGKIHAEFAPLLQKEGKLTPEEWELMKTHAAKSAELVDLFSRFHGHVVESVRHHHERWDGLGYPDGLGGSQIPLGARIIMIADTIDAMTTDRPYRKALGFDAVVAELEKHKGTQFDPRLVETAVTSVSVRRLISQVEIPHQDHTKRSVPKSSAFRSYGSMFLGRRAGS